MKKTKRKSKQLKPLLTKKQRSIKLEEMPAIELPPMKARRMWNPETKSGFLAFTMADTHVEVTHGEKVIGSVDAPIGGGIIFQLGDKIEDRYKVTTKELWNAFVKAVGKPELVIP
jgi:hypothetical protein